MNCGTYSSYVLGCRCEPCKAGNRAYIAAYRARKRVQRQQADDALRATAEATGRILAAVGTRAVNLRHALTYAEWRAREQAHPDCLPVTQQAIRLRHEVMQEVAGG